MNYLIYPTKKMLLSQTYLDSYSHSICATGNIKDYPIDETCGTSERSYFYCPCDEVIIRRIYGVGNGGTNTIWIESTSPVVTPTFTDYVTIMVIHPNDDTLSGLYPGQTFKRKEAMFLEGNDGDATGYHFHISIARGKFIDSGWAQNDKGCFVIRATGESQKPENCFYIDKSFTTIIDSKNLKFIELNNVIGDVVEKNTNNNQLEVIVDNLHCRNNHSLSAKIIGFIKPGIYDYYDVAVENNYTWYSINPNNSWWLAYSDEWMRLYPKELPKEEENDEEKDNGSNEPTGEVIENEKESVLIFLLEKLGSAIKYIKKLFKKLFKR